MQNGSSKRSPHQQLVSTFAVRWMVLFGIEKKKLILFSEYTAALTLFSKTGNNQLKKINRLTNRK